MSTRSLIGILHDDGTYQARYCHNDGYPSHQVRQLAEALHRYHGGDAEQLLEEILREDWSSMAPAAASAELATGGRSPYKPDHVVPHAGIGYFYTDSTEDPMPGALTEDTEIDFEWLYLFTGDQLRVFANDYSQRRWRGHRDYQLYDLKDVDALDSWSAR
jgi:hypothetical protein